MRTQKAPFRAARWIAALEILGLLLLVQPRLSQAGGFGDRLGTTAKKISLTVAALGLAAAFATACGPTPNPAPVPPSPTPIVSVVSQSPSSSPSPTIVISPSPSPSPSPAPNNGGQTASALSQMPLDTSVVPRPYSNILPGAVEQCGEFVFRYFNVHGVSAGNYPTLGQPAEYIRGGNYKSTDPAFRNGGTTPPRAGDIAAAIGPAGSGGYHTALIWKVDSNAVWVYQANVPLGNGSSNPQDHIASWPLQQRADGTYYIPALPTSHLGYGFDMTVVGWIHPVGAGALADAAQ